MNKIPLADRIRPKTLKDFVGQEHLLGKNGPIRKALETNTIPSMIFWGPPGTGKTTLARIIAQTTGFQFLGFSAVLSGINDVRKVAQQAKLYNKAYNKSTILFVDEIHRFNKAQQDAFLPYVEDGTIILIGATTENPSFEIIGPLLSRTIVYTLNRLNAKEILGILNKALTSPEGLADFNPLISEETKEYIAGVSDGDARVALNILEFACMTTKPSNGKREIVLETVKEAIKRAPLLYDKKGEEHYNLISAFTKSLRGSDVDASLYWLARMIEAGEDPLFIARRMIIFASEDIGNADPQGLCLATSCKEAVHFVGMPEGFLSLAQTAIYLASAPKSNAVLVSYKKALKDVKEKGSLPVPLHIRNAPTSLMSELGYGKGYKYPHNHKGVKQNYMPEGLEGKKYYE